jgi:glycosyltransferase involved in cell wall biosynthesis
MSSDLSILFVGLGNSAPMYYRCMLPAHTLGHDYVGVYGEPSNLHYATGIVQGESRLPNMFDYEVVILQQPRGREWADLIKALRAAGALVLVEVDDYLHGVSNQADHDFRDHYGKSELAKYEECFKAADGMIVSTPHLARVYRAFNRRTYVCENGIDPRRYAYTRPPRDTVNIGIVCATGHRDSAMPWLQATAQVMAQREHTTFVSIGQPFASGFVPHFGDRRAISVPFTAIESYPAAMALLDIALAPGGSTSWHRAKSQLRYLEAGALGIPLVANPDIYPAVIDGETGEHARDATQAYSKLLALVDDPQLREEQGEGARADVLGTRTIQHAALQWAHAIEDARRAVR